MQRAALGRTTVTKLRLLYKATFKTLRVWGAVGRQVRTHHHLPRASAEVEVEDFPISPEFRVSCPTFSAVLGLGTERAPKMHFLSPVPTHHRTLLPSLHMTTEHIGLVHQNPVWTDPRPTRHLMHHHMRPATLGHLEEATNLPTVNLPHSSGLAAEPADTAIAGAWAGSAAVWGTVGLRNRNRKNRMRERTRVSGRETGHMGSLEVLPDSLEVPPDFPTLNNDTGSEPEPWSERMMGLRT